VVGRAFPNSDSFVGLMMAIAGLAIIFMGNGASGHFEPVGGAAILFAVVAHTISSIWVKRIGGHLSPMSLNSGALIVATPLFVLVWWFFGPDLPDELSQRALGAIVYLGLIGTALGFNLYYYVLRHISAGSISLITLITPVLALWIGSQINGEQLTVHIVIGVVMILTGLLLYQWRFMMHKRAQLLSKA
jgi:drug/metabolite transporter (DMT)-like permease